MLTVYGDEKSGNCLKVRWTAEKLAIPYRWRELDVLRSETRTPDFLALNPAGQVPLAILADGRALAQSNAIIVHLAEGSALIPADSYDRARMFEWLFWEQYSHEPYVAVARFQMVYLGKPREALDPNLVQRGRAALQRLEDGLEETAFLVGDHVSLADVALVAYTRLAPEGGFDLADYPRVVAWVARVEAELGIS
ncbi:MAG: glutathione S-transferase family protein [Caulobacter sp.]|nr:glutathione S-transferase family protein [Caulobacter sp.]